GGCDQDGVGGRVQFEMLAGMRQGVVRDQRSNVRKFGRFGLQELLARGGIEKQVADGDGSSRRQSGLFDFENLAAVDFDYGAGVVAGSLGFQTQAGNRGNGRQGLATKAEGGDAQQVVGILDFGGGVAFEGEQSIVANHAAAVIGDLDEFF